MKAKILGLILVMGLSTVLVAQTNENGPAKANRGQKKEMRMNSEQRGPGNGMNLTDAQKDAFKQSMMAMHKQLQPLHNALGEAEAHQKTLVMAEKPDLGAINKNIEKIGDIKVEIAKIQTKHHLDMRAQLTDEQRLMFDMHKGMNRMDRGAKGIGHMQMQRGPGMN